jgi:hypothetical protein
MGQLRTIVSQQKRRIARAMAGIGNFSRLPAYGKSM